MQSWDIAICSWASVTVWHQWIAVILIVIATSGIPVVVILRTNLERLTCLSSLYVKTVTYLCKQITRVTFRICCCTIGYLLVGHYVISCFTGCQYRIYRATGDFCQSRFSLVIASEGQSYCIVHGTGKEFLHLYATVMCNRNRLVLVLFVRALYRSIRVIASPVLRQHITYLGVHIPFTGDVITPSE